MACEPGSALYGHSNRDKRVDGCPGRTRRPAQSSVAQSWDGVGWSCGCWGSVVTPASGSPLSSGAGGPWLIEMQGTGWQAAAAAYRQNPAEKGRRDGGGG